MDWSGYQYFLAVAETGSLSAAARHLGVSQPTVGRQVQALEESLKARLFIRTPTGYELTSAGHEIVELAQDIEERTVAIRRRIGGQDSKLSGRICIAVTEGLATFWLASKVPLLKHRHPEIEIELKVGIPAHDLTRWEADVALRVGSPVCDELVGRCISEVGFGLYASDTYLATHGEPAAIADLAGHSLIGSTGEIANLPQVRKLSDLSKTASVSMSCNFLMTQFMAMRHGLGLLALPHYMAAAAPDVRRVLAADFDVTLDLWVLTHRDLKETARVRATIDFLCEEIDAARAHFRGQANDLGPILLPHLAEAVACRTVA